MQLSSFWSKPLALTASISLAAIAFSPSVKAQEPPTDSYLIAQSCAVVVNAPNGLTVRSQPSINSTVLGTLRNRQPVTVESNNLEGWTPIISPMEGYVFGEYLTYCSVDQQPDSVTPPANNCREVSASMGLNVRNRPSINSTVVARLANNQEVQIVNRGQGGWVEITSPVNGFIASQYLGYCD
ncbi:MAG: SH3 domain-containing protein [Chroococcales cyanobacterium]